MLFTLVHDAGEFIARSERDVHEVVEMVEARWGLDVTAIREATGEDVAQNLGQITDIDTDV